MKEYFYKGIVSMSNLSFGDRKRYSVRIFDICFSLKNYQWYSERMHGDRIGFSFKIPFTGFWFRVVRLKKPKLPPEDPTTYEKHWNEGKGTIVKTKKQ